MYPYGSRYKLTLAVCKRIFYQILLLLFTIRLIATEAANINIFCWFLYFVITMLYSMYVVLLGYCMCVYCYLYSVCIVLHFCALCIMSLQQGRTALPIVRRLNYKSNQNTRAQIEGIQGYTKYSLLRFRKIVYLLTSCLINLDSNPHH